MTNQFPIDLMLEQPTGWLKASLPKIISTSGAIKKIAAADPLASFEKYSNQVKEENWQKITGFEAQNSHFTVIIPVHNEERSLPSFLGALLTSEIPSTTDALFIFVVNSSTDQSQSIIMRRLSAIAPLQKITLPTINSDPNISENFYQMCYGKVRFWVMSTSTPGKSNALNIGNEIAKKQLHDIAISIDANNWVEPDSISLQFNSAKEAFLQNPDSKIVIINSKEFGPIRGSEDDVITARKVNQKAEVTGWMFSWSTKWVDENTGFAKRVIDDYALGLLALSQGMVIAFSDANIWGYSAANAIDENIEIIRFTVGALQLAHQYKNNLIAINILQDDFPSLRPLQKRVDFYILSRIRKNETLSSIIKGVIRWLLNEIIIFRAQMILVRNPQKQTWRPIQSTK